MYRVRMLYNNDPTRVITAVTGPLATFGWEGRDMSLMVGGEVTIGSVEGPRYEGSDDELTIDQFDWNQLLDGTLPSVEAPFILAANAQGWGLDTRTSDVGVPVTIEGTVQDAETDRVSGMIPFGAKLKDHVDLVRAAIRLGGGELIEIVDVPNGALQMVIEHGKGVDATARLHRALAPLFSGFWDE